jgi:hypothetical protein
MSPAYPVKVERCVARTTVVTMFIEGSLSSRFLCGRETWSVTVMVKYISRVLRSALVPGREAAERVRNHLYVS